MHENRNGIAWLALVVAVLALVLGWSAFNRSGVDVEDVVERQVRESAAEMEQKYQDLEVRVRGNTSAGLRNAATDVATDTDPTTPGE